MKPGLVSVLITSYNRPKYLAGAIDSVLNQTYQNFELWILDDNSNAETQAVIQKYSTNEKIKVYNSLISEEDRRITDCRYAHNINWALKHVEGEFITYLTDDDFFYPNRLQDMVDYFNTHPEVEAIYGDQHLIDVDEQGNENIRGTRVRRGILTQAAFNIDHNSFMHRKSVTDKIGDWPTYDFRCGDAAFFNKMSISGINFYAIEKLTDAKRYHPYTLSAKMDRKEELFGTKTE